MNTTFDHPVNEDLIELVSKFAQKCIHVIIALFSFTLTQKAAYRENILILEKTIKR